MTTNKRQVQKKAPAKIKAPTAGRGPSWWATLARLQREAKGGSR